LLLSPPIASLFIVTETIPKIYRRQGKLCKAAGKRSDSFFCHVKNAYKKPRRILPWPFYRLLKEL